MRVGSGDETSAWPCFQRSPRPFQLFRARVKGEGLGSEARAMGSPRDCRARVVFPTSASWHAHCSRERGERDAQLVMLAKVNLNLNLSLSLSLSLVKLL